jgi:hypothetical protein
MKKIINKPDFITSTSLLLYMIGVSYLEKNNQKLYDLFYSKPPQLPELS